jgi:hypothetical protein
MPDSCVEVLDIMLPCQRVRCVYTAGRGSEVEYEQWAFCRVRNAFFLKSACFRKVY